MGLFGTLDEVAPSWRRIVQLLLGLVMAFTAGIYIGWCNGTPPDKPPTPIPTQSGP